MNIRIDDRLIHGQIVTTWVNELKVSTIYVVDTPTANNPILKKALAFACPQNIKLFIIKDEELSQGELENSENKLYIFKYPKNVRSTLESLNRYQNINLNVGNVSMAPERKSFSNTVHLDEEDINALNFLKEKGCNIFLQTVPGEKKINY